MECNNDVCKRRRDRAVRRRSLVDRTRDAACLNRWSGAQSRRAGSRREPPRRARPSRPAPDSAVASPRRPRAGPATPSRSDARPASLPRAGHPAGPARCVLPGRAAMCTFCVHRGNALSTRCAIASPSVQGRPATGFLRPPQSVRARRAAAQGLRAPPGSPAHCPDETAENRRRHGARNTRDHALSFRRASRRLHDP